jgi:FkbM family methyltransferase
VPLLSRLPRLRQDVTGVARTVDPATLVRWLTGLVVKSPEIVRTGGLVAADAMVGSRTARITVPSGQVALIPGRSFSAAREIYCRNVYLRRGLEVPAGGWVVDLGANQGMFSTLCAVMGAQVLAVEAQPKFADEIVALARRNRVEDRMHVVTALIKSNRADIGATGVLTDEERWRMATHTDGSAPVELGMNELLAKFGVDRIALLKIDIEGGEFSLLDPADDLAWLDRVDQIAMEVHPTFGAVPTLVELYRAHGFRVEQTDNDGVSVVPEDPAVSYVYARRS